jgi:UDP-N-acetylbacillosamine N-acetyltransferase
MTQENIVLLGGGGHAISCAQLARNGGISILGYFDDDPNVEFEFLGLKKAGSIKDFLNSCEAKTKVIIGIGDHDHGLTRVSIFNRLFASSISIMDLHSSNSNYQDLKLGPRSNQVFDHTYFGPACMLGSNNIFNTNSIIEHQVKIGSHCHIGPGAVICGRAMIGDQVLVGANSTVLPGTEINSGNIIGAGCLVNKSLFSSGGIYIGNPAKKIGEWDFSV